MESPAGEAMIARRTRCGFFQLCAQEPPSPSRGACVRARAEGTATLEKRKGAAPVVGSGDHRAGGIDG